MAEEQTKKLEREYVVPLRREWLNVEGYRRAGRASRAIKKFIAKHMKVQDRDIDKVKIDGYLNNELFFRGRANPPSRIKVKATKEGEIVRVEFVETPEHVKFLKAKNERFHKAAEKKEEKKEEKQAEAKPEGAEQKKDEKEKEKAVESQQIKEAKKEAKAEKHTQKKKAPEIRRTSMNRH